MQRREFLTAAAVAGVAGAMLILLPKRSYSRRVEGKGGIRPEAASRMMMWW